MGGCWLLMGFGGEFCWCLSGGGGAVCWEKGGQRGGEVSKEERGKVNC